MVDRAFLVAQGATILQHVGDYGLKPEDMAGTEVVIPTLAFSERMVMDLGGEEVQLIRTAPSHTTGSLVVYLPAKKLLFSGDILFSNFHPYLADADMNGWINTIDDLLAMDVEHIVPGHGPLSGKKDLREMKEYLLLFDSKAKELAATSQNAEANAAHLLKNLPKRSMAEWMVAYNLKARYMGKK